MSSFKILAGTSLLLLCAASATAQDTQPTPRPTPRLLLRRPAQDGIPGGPRVREAGPRLGVSVEATPDGLKVGAVDDGSLAASAGLKADDVLMRIGDKRVHTVDDVALALHGQEPGAKVSITVVRPGEGLVTLEGTLPERAPEPAPMAPDGMQGGFLGVQMKTDGGGCSGGVAVGGVVPDSAAWFAGLEEGDCLLSIDGKSLTGPEDLAGAVAAKEPGTLVELRFLRDGTEQSSRVRLGHRGALGMLGGLGQSGAFAPGVLRLRAPHFDADDDDQPFALKLDIPDDAFGMHGGGFDMPGLQDLDQLFSDLQGRMGNGAQSLEVQIEDDHMTVTHDGVTETYERDANGNWIKQDTAAPAPKSDEDA